MVKDALVILVFTIDYESAFSIGVMVLDAFRIFLNLPMVETLFSAQN